MRQLTDPARCARCAPGALCHNHAGPGDVSAEQILAVVFRDEHTSPADVAAAARPPAGSAEYIPPGDRLHAFAKAARRKLTAGSYLDTPRETR
jgi:hypothetical protein